MIPLKNYIILFSKQVKNKLEKSDGTDFLTLPCFRINFARRIHFILPAFENLFVNAYKVQLFKRQTPPCRSSNSEVLCEKGVLESFVKFTKKRLCWSPFISEYLLKSDSSTAVFLWNFKNKLFKYTFLVEHLRKPASDRGFFLEVFQKFLRFQEHQWTNASDMCYILFFYS